MTKMNKSGITRRLALASNTSDAEAADYLDQAVLSILKRWKHGQCTPWPGLGVFSSGTQIATTRKILKTEAL